MVVLMVVTLCFGVFCLDVCYYLVLLFSLGLVMRVGLGFRVDSIVGVVVIVVCLFCLWVSGWRLLWVWFKVVLLGFDCGGNCLVYCASVLAVSFLVWFGVVCGLAVWFSDFDALLIGWLLGACLVVTMVCWCAGGVACLGCFMLV